jgi:chloramphenicol O-acetyltransferase type B
MSMAARRRLLIISNCQVQPLKHGLAAVCADTDFDIVPVHVVAKGDRVREFKKILKDKAKYAGVLAINLSEEFGPFSTQDIAGSFHPVPVFSISNLYFSGLQPDATYIGGLSQRAPGPIGDYHSQLALLGYLLGLGVPQTVSLYCDIMYRYLGYYDAFQTSLDEMRSRDAHTDIPIGDLLESCVRQGVCFLSQNHPTSLLLAPYINRISAYLAERGIVDKIGDIQAGELVNYLAYSSVFPVFPEIAARHDMPYAGNYIFRSVTEYDVPGRVMDLERFVSGEFEAFRQADQKILRETYPGNLLLMKYSDDHIIKSILGRLQKAAGKKPVEAQAVAPPAPAGGAAGDETPPQIVEDSEDDLIGLPFGNDTGQLRRTFPGLDLTVGKYSYGHPSVHYAPNHPKSKLDIGAFCSIGGEVEIFVGIGGRHGIDMMTSFPITMVFDQQVVGGDPSNAGEGDLAVSIGSDVWIAQRVTIMNGVKIGHGAVIQAGSVVQDNVRPYEIVSGNPARHVGYRFSQDIIERLLRLEWWNWSDQKIKDNLNYFFRLDMAAALDVLENI